MPVLFLVIACALWGLSFPVLKALMTEQGGRVPEASTTFLAAWIQLARFLFGAVLMIPFVARLSRPTALEMRQGLMLALWGGLGMGIQADGLFYTEASTSAFLTQAYCVILPLWACLRTRQWPTKRIVSATLLVMIGGAILSGFRAGSIGGGRGEIETVVAAFFFALQILTLENPRFAGTRGRTVTMIMCLGIAALYLPVALVLAPTPAAMLVTGASGQSLVLVATLSLFCTVGAFLLINTWQRKVSATEAGLIYTSEPVFAASYALFLPAILAGFIGHAYPNETLTVQMLIGGGLILLANAVMQWKHKPHRPGIAPTP